MQSLLTWGIQNSTSAGVPENRQKLDPEIIDMILGRPDSELMKQALAIATDVNTSEDDRLDALDQFEMLIEQIDNANNLQKLQMWEPLQALLTADASSQALKAAVLWIIGTALQNNPSAQDDYMQYHPLPHLLNFLTPTAESTLLSRSKAMYALSGLLKHNAPAVDALGPEGWNKMREALQDPDIGVRRKAMFLLSALLIPNEHSSSPNFRPNLHGPGSPPPTSSSDADGGDPTVSHTNTQPIHANSHAAHLFNPGRTSTSRQTFQALQKYGILDAIVSGLAHPVPYGEDGDQEGPDHDFQEKGIRLLYTYLVNCHGQLTEEQRKTLESWISDQLKSAGSEKGLAERWSLDSSELKKLLDSTRA